ncbi:MAG: IstA3 [Candidatus Magnetoglobus multicellularis str. Araruama]|uniref:IstA3 n=1 Tax=Candidatus Magnetoglobus multicellularis str. Araruama TaxID=890399 RepID=A0A1V1NZA4_9BACT|nr:MAG: IstA3 [Candidatus Magnetoglobus multicellularis str. Araruama]
MIERRIIFEIHRLKDAGLSQREISKRVGISRPSVQKYITSPEQSINLPKKKASKIDSFTGMIDEFLKEDPFVKAPVVLQRIQEKGFDGQITIVRKYLKTIRDNFKPKEAFIRFESDPGEQIQVDWGEMGSIQCGNTRRKVYALAMTECHSRMLYVQFMHRQNQASLHWALMNGFIFFGGTPKRLVVDNMLTAVTERYEKIIRFNAAFLDFLRPLHIEPYACNIRSPHEKGKIEKVIGYIKSNFWPLRKYIDITDVQRQGNQWRDVTANIRIHGTTGEKPGKRIQRDKLRALPEILPDLRETRNVKVYKDFSVKFDANSYTVPPRMVGKYVCLKADPKTVTIYYKENKIATHFRCWERKKRIEIPAHNEQVKKLKRKLWQDRNVQKIVNLCEEATEYLEGLSKACLPVKKSVTRLISLQEEYGKEALISAIKKAKAYKAYGVDYIENILYQEMTPQNNHQPVILKNEDLNQIDLETPMLEDYDQYILERRKNESRRN